MEFEPLRPTLMRVAYRMLGSVSNAEDVVQEAFIRWMRTDRGGVHSPEAFLRRAVTRLCLDLLKSVNLQRLTYLGPWLPDPIIEEDQVEDVTLPLMLALERLPPAREPGTHSRSPDKAPISHREGAWARDRTCLLHRLAQRRFCCAW